MTASGGVIDTHLSRRERRLEIQGDRVQGERGAWCLPFRQVANRNERMD